MRALALLAIAALALPAQGQGRQDPNLAHPHELLTVKRGGYTIAGLVTHLAGKKELKYGLALFPGHPGILKLREEGGELKFDMRGNFLVRTRRHWLDRETLVMVVDAPSDHWPTFYQEFRETPRYGADVGALVAEASRKYGVADWTFIGTSEGSLSAFHAARMNPELARRVILTSSVFVAGKNGPGLSRVKFDALKSELLWVHHADDPCRFTSYRDAQAFAKRSGRPLVTVRGGGPRRGDDCEAFTAHGFVGVEIAALRAMHSWIRTAQVPADVAP
jgi:pimeloyl-ACP methyl ester carboxylesterase